MSEVAAELPARRTEPGTDAGIGTSDTDATGVLITGALPAGSGQSGFAAAGGSGLAASAGAAVDRAQELASDAADRVQEAAGEAVEKVGDAVERATNASGRIAAQVVDRLRNNAELAAERGTTTIANEVVEKIAGIAAREVPGVYDLGGDVARVFSAVRERVGLGEHEADQGVAVRLDGTTAHVKITIVIEYGFVVYSVTEKVRAKVISAVENLLGLEVTGVDIVVDDVHIPDSAPVGNDEERAAGYQA